MTSEQLPAITRAGALATSDDTHLVPALIADAGDMARAHDALADYRLAVRWSECQQFDTNLIGTYQWCPLAKKT